MKVKFLGVGEAFDEDLPNTSILVRAEERHTQNPPPAARNSGSILLDCGFTAPPQFWRSCPDPDGLDALWVSHFHGDHFFGIPALLTRFWESGRKRPFLIAGQEGVEQAVCAAIRLAYPSIMEKFTFELQFLIVHPATVVEAAGMSWSTAQTGHSQKDLALRLGEGEKSVFYSGDGPPTDATLDLARGCGLAIHEAFSLDREIGSHGNILGCIDFARRAGARALALVHIERHERRQRRREILEAIEGVRDLRVFMPEPGDEVEI